MELDDPGTFARLVGARGPVPPKEDWIVERARGRRVLDLGCIDHDVETALGLGERWLHRRLRDAAASLVGLDLLEDAAAALSADHGYDIRHGDVETFDLGERFDLVVAGDLIEHLSNPGLFLERVAAHLDDGGQAVITTPNPFNVEQVLQAVFRDQLFVNPEHALWLDPRTMHQLVSRSPLRVVDFQWIDTRFHFRLKGGRVLRRLVNPLADVVMRRHPLVGRDYGVVLERR